MPTEKEILNQINVNYDALDKLKAQYSDSLPVYRRLEIEKQIRSLWQAQQYWAKQYFSVTGKSIVLFSGYLIEGDPYAVAREEADAKARLEQQQKRSAAIAEIKDGIHAVQQDYQRLTLILQDQYDIATVWYAAFFSDLARMTTGLDARHPLRIKRQLEENVPPKLLDATRAFEAGDYEKTQRKTASAAKWVQWGYERLAVFLASIEQGAGHAVAGIKVSAAVLTLAVGAIVEVPAVAAWVTAGAAGASSEAGQQITTLVLNSTVGGHSLTADDITKAALAVAVNGFTAAGSTAFGGFAASKITQKFGKEILSQVGKSMTTENAKALEKVLSDRIANYVSTNSQTIINKMLKLDTEPDWNWWYTVVTPAFNGISVEMAKEPALVNMAK